MFSISSMSFCFSSKALATSLSFLLSRSIGVIIGWARKTSSPGLTTTSPGFTSSLHGSVKCKSSTFCTFLLVGNVLVDAVGGFHESDEAFEGVLLIDRCEVLLLSSSDPA